MKCLISAIFCVLLLVDYSEGSYSARVNLKTDILVYLTTSNGTHVCNAALVTDFQVVIAAICFMRQTPHDDDLRIKIQDVHELIMIQETIWRSVNFYDKYSFVALLTLRTPAPLSRNMYVEGWLGNIDTHVNQRRRMMIYGYEAMDRLPASAEVTFYSEPEAVDHYFEFRILSNPCESTWRGSPVFYERHLLAICNTAVMHQRISCLRMSYVSDYVLQNLHYNIPLPPL